MSNYPPSHLFASNNIYKIVLSMEDINENILPHVEDGSEKNLK